MGVGGRSEVFATAGRSLARGKAGDDFEWGEYITGLKQKYKALPKNDQALAHLPHNYILVPLQMEKDTSILYDSQKIKTMHSLIRYCMKVARAAGKSLVIKKHPRDPHINIDQFSCDYVHIETDIPVNDLIANAEAIIGVNSTCLIEGLIHYKPIYCFGTNVATGGGPGVYFTGGFPASDVLTPGEMKKICHFRPDKRNINRLLFDLSKTQFSRGNPPDWVAKLFE